MRLKTCTKRGTDWRLQRGEIKREREVKRERETEREREIEACQSMRNNV